MGTQWYLGLHTDISTVRVKSAEKSEGGEKEAPLFKEYVTWTKMINLYNNSIRTKILVN